MLDCSSIYFSQLQPFFCIKEGMYASAVSSPNSHCIRLSLQYEATFTFPFLLLKLADMPDWKKGPYT